MTDRPRVQIHYRRPPDRIQLFDQVVVHEREDVIVTLAESIEMGEAMRIDGSIVLENGSSAVWFTYPGAWHDIGRFHRADGTFTGIYANILTPPEIEGRVWHTTDLFLDVWMAPSGDVRVLDEDELRDAVEAGHIDGKTAARARTEASALVEAARRRLWPPPIVSEWTLERARSGVG